MPADPSLNPASQPGRPTFGTSAFARSPEESTAYVDATAEETCPAPEPDNTAKRSADATAASPEVMDQLKALAQNVTRSQRALPERRSMSDDTNVGARGAAPAAEPSIRVLPRPAGFQDTLAGDRASSFGRRARTFAGIAAAALIGAGGTLAWKAHVKPGDVAIPARPPAPAAPAISPDLVKQLDALAQDIGSVRRGIDELSAKRGQLAALQQQLEQLKATQQQLAAKQDQVGQSLAKLQALEQARQRAPAPVARATPVPRPSTPPPTPVEPAPPPPLPPRTASHPVPPLPIPP